MFLLPHSILVHYHEITFRTDILGSIEGVVIEGVDTKGVVIVGGVTVGVVIGVEGASDVSSTSSGFSVVASSSTAVVVVRGAMIKHMPV